MKDFDEFGLAEIENDEKRLELISKKEAKNEQ